MSISTSVATIYKADIIQGVMNVSTDVYMVALYTSSASLDNTTTVYTSTNECSGGNYPSGGIVMPNASEVTSGSVAILTFTNPTFINLTLPDVRGCMIYNLSKGSTTVAVFDFGLSIALYTSNFELIVPAPTATTGLIRFN
jgi:hypothetical protein